MEEENTRLKRIVADLTLDKRCCRTCSQKNSKDLAVLTCGGVLERELPVSERRACRLTRLNRGRIATAATRSVDGVADEDSGNCAEPSALWIPKDSRAADEI